MKKYLFYIIIAMSFLCAPSINAETNVTGFVTEKDVLFASAPNLTLPGNNCLYKENGRYSSIFASPGKAHCIDTSEKVIILNYDSIISSSNNTCGKGYYKANYTNEKGNTYTGYICADKVIVEVDTNKYAEYFTKNGIPKIYWTQLALLKEAHPNWNFRGYNTNLDFNTAVNNEEGASAIHTDDPKYLSLNTDYSYNPDTNTYNMLPEGNGWRYANTKTIAFYMDPRNFFDDKKIFMFESLGFNPELHTLDAVKAVLNGTDLAQYADIFYEAARYKDNNISPVYLATLSKQEVVIEGGHLSPSASGENSYQNGIYNFYNIGANSSCTNAVKCGIEWAMNIPKNLDGSIDETRRFDRVWNSPRLAILGGATKIAVSFIKNGQVNSYLKKFNVTPNGRYSNQYQTNIAAPATEADKTARAYDSAGKLNEQFDFVIPVYNNMPENPASLPTTKEEYVKEKEEVVEDNTMNAINNSGYAVNGQYLINVPVGTSVATMKSRISANIKVTCDGREIDGNQVIGTADVLHINGHTYMIIIKGDATGDGKISPADYMAIKDHIMGEPLKKVFQVSGDMNGDGQISPADYMTVKDYIMSR